MLELTLVAPAGAADPNTGPGGPILVVTSPGSTFSKFYAEILRAEGLNQFAVVDVGSVTSSTLASYDVVILANSTLSSTQLTAFTNWVNNGGNLIAMDPNSQLQSLLGVTVSGATISNGYLLPEASTEVGNGIARTTMQYHGPARLITLNGATRLATLYSDATNSTGASAVTLRNVGSNGGQTAAFAFDLAKSIVYTRQGNPAWAAQERDGLAPIRSGDKFFGAANGDDQQNWVDLNKVHVPQADEQQRMLANLITIMNRDRKPLPRFWYLPNGHRAAVVMTGDDHALGGTLGRFNQLIAASTPGCNLANWECVRGTSYVFPDTPISNAQMAAFNAAGFEISLHVNTGCQDYTQSSLDDFYSQQLEQFQNAYPSLPSPLTQRHHCIVWSDWASGAKVQFGHGMRLDTTYYYWPASWVNNVPGNFTGSAMPMRFADLDGTLIDVYQVASQMTDESGQAYPFTVDTLLDRALGDQEQYGVYTINAHTDVATIPESTAVVTSAQARGVPIISARQMLTWLDGRNGSTFGAINYSGTTLTFSVTQASGAQGLRGLVPWRSSNGLLNSIRRGTTDVPYEVITFKGIEYASFAASSGNYTASYTADTVAPTVVSREPASGATGVDINTSIAARFNEAMDPGTISASTFELRTASNALVPATIFYDAAAKSARMLPDNPLAAGSTYTVRVRGGTTDPRVKDLLGNALVADAVWSFTTAGGNGCPCPGWPPTAVPGTPSVNDSGAVTLGVKFRANVDGIISGIRFYKGAANTGTHLGSLWSASGSLLATAVFQNETASGWQQVTFSTPVAISANSVYVASYFAPNGNYAADGGFFGVSHASGAIHFLSSSEASGNGVYAYGPTNSFPASTWNSTNYWVDVLFTPASQTDDTTAPTVAISSPTSSATFDTTTNPLALAGTAGDNLGVAHVTWSNSAGGSGTATGTTSWSIPTIALAPGSNVLTVTAIDAAGLVATDTVTVTLSPDVTAPTVAARTPAPGATGLAVTATVSVTFSEALDAATVNGSSFELRAGSTLIPAQVTYSAASFVASLTPAESLSPSTTYTVTLRGGGSDPRIEDLAGLALASTVSWTFTTSADPCPCTIWPASAVPTVASDGDSAAVEVGVKFRSATAGSITGIRFFKGSANTGTHTAHLWTGAGQLLGTATFGPESSFGWQQANFAAPVAIDANTTYVASYHAPNGHYAIDQGTFSSGGVSRGGLTALASGEDGDNGVYSYGISGTFPESSWQSTNYWVDVVFVGSGPPDTTAPTIAARTPASGATGVNLGAPVTVRFNEAVASSTVTTSTLLLRLGANTVPATVSYNALTFTATLSPTNLLNASTVYTATVRGGSSGVKNVAGIALAADSSWSFTPAAANANCNVNAITAENCLTGNVSSEWDVTGAGDPTIQGFATQMSVNRGSTIQFKVDTDATNYRFDIYRMGYYGGRGARKVATVNPSASLPQIQPNCILQVSTGLIDCGVWSVSGSWTVPSSATSGIYFARLVREDTEGASHIVFIVRNDAGAADVVFQTADTTWQAYNNYGGNSLYQGAPGTNPGRAYKVSYNRPFNTRAVDGGQDWVFNAEYPMVRWLESNGYDVTYISGVDTDRNANLVTSRRLFLSVGHDEYWSGAQRANVEAARAAGVHLAFFSGNEVFWKTRWENSIDGSGSAYRTLVSYKETHANAKLDPSALWTGTWRDPRFSPPADGGRPEHALTGQSFAVNAGTAAITVPAADGKMRFWRNTSIAALSGGSATLAPSTLGYEWDVHPVDAARPAGAFRLSTTTVSGVDLLQDFGSTYEPGTATHSMSLYRASSGALVFGAGTVQWSWGLDSNHDRGSDPADLRMQQATVNLFADMNVQPANLHSSLVAASMSTDAQRPVTSIALPLAGSTISAGSSVTISGTATDSGGVVAAVEVSTDNGATWGVATGRANWTYVWNATGNGAVVILVRAVDDSGNIETPAASRSVTVAGASTSCPCSLWPATATPGVAAENDSGAVEIGVKFRASVAGRITGIRFYKGAGNTGTHVAHLWTSSGSLLGTATFNNETATGWQEANFTTPVNIQAGTVYVASYFAPAGRYAADNGYFNNSGLNSGPLYALQNGESGGNGLYMYGPSGGFPTSTWLGSNYWVDVVFVTP